MANKKMRRQKKWTNKEQHRLAREQKRNKLKQTQTVIKEFQTNLGAFLKAGIEQQDILDLVEEYKNNINIYDLEEDAAEQWALIKEYYDMVNAGLIEPTLNYKDRYYAVRLMQDLLTEDGLRVAVNEAKRKREKLVAEDAKRRESRADFARNVIDF